MTIQAQIDAAAAGSIVNVSDAAESFTVTKPLTIVGPAQVGQATIRADGVTLDRLTHQNAIYGVLSYGNDIRITNPTFRDLGCAAEIHGQGTTIEDFTVTDMNRKVTNDWGGTGFNLWNSAQTVIQRGTMAHLRTPTGEVPNFPNGDGGAFAFYAGAKDTLIQDVSISDSINIMEDGIDLGTPSQSNTKFLRVTAKGDPNYHVAQWWNTDLQKVCMGFLFRATQGLTVEDCDLLDLDAWVFHSDHSGNHYGVVSNVQLTNNRVRLKAGDNRAYLILAGVDPAQISVANDIQDAEFGTGSIAYKEDIKGNTSDLATFKTWGLASVADTWGPIVTTPPPDPCSGLKAQILAVLNDKKKTQQQRITAIKALIA